MTTYDVASTIHQSLDAGRAPTYADDLEAAVFSLSYMRAGTTPWVPVEQRGDFDAVMAGKATVDAPGLAAEEADQEWLW
jgi:hypothetical protein